MGPIDFRPLVWTIFILGALVGALAAVVIAWVIA